MEGKCTSCDMKKRFKREPIMEEIEVGEYIRTCTGEIYKYEKSIEYTYKCDNFYGRIVKHSKNIIDLIEKEDYVNGYRVENISVETNEVLLDHNGFGWRTLKDGDKIVTKELFKSVEYEVN